MSTRARVRSSRAAGAFTRSRLKLSQVEIHTAFGLQLFADLNHLAGDDKREQAFRLRLPYARMTSTWRSTGRYGITRGDQGGA
jgi:hypothetical protein